MRFQDKIRIKVETFHLGREEKKIVRENEELLDKKEGTTPKEVTISTYFKESETKYEKETLSIANDHYRLNNIALKV